MKNKATTGRAVKTPDGYTREKRGMGPPDPNPARTTVPAQSAMKVPHSAQEKWSDESVTKVPAENFVLDRNSRVGGHQGAKTP